MYLKNYTRSWTVVHLASLQYRRSWCGEITQCRPLPRFRLQRIRSIGTSPRNADAGLPQNWNITHLFLGKRVWKISVQSIGSPFQDPMLQKIHISPQWPYLVDKSHDLPSISPLELPGTWLDTEATRGHLDSLGTP